MSEGLTAAALISISTWSSPRDNGCRSTTGDTSAGVPALRFSREQRASTDTGGAFVLFSVSIALSGIFEHHRISRNFRKHGIFASPTLSAVFVNATMPACILLHRGEASGPYRFGSG